MIEQQQQNLSQASAPIAPPIAAPPSASAPLAENSTFFENSPILATQPPHSNTAQTISPTPQPLSDRQLAAINALIEGQPEISICCDLKIHRKTLYNWKHKNPLFIVELNRRHEELWRDTADQLRLSVNHAIQVLNKHLNNHADDMTQLRAARALIALVNSKRLAPTNPTRVSDVLDALLRAAQPPKPAQDAPTFTDAQRQQLLDQLLKNDDPDPEPYPPRKKRPQPH